ncbi:MAG TPA: diacylglycerol kinase family protein [Actinomycetota bacterium]|nr:diacylglycerol kinase family protein [Actinomycetota bacterium]
MTSPFGVLALIADPGMRAQLPAVERALAARGLEHRTFVANGVDPAAVARDALDEGHRFVVAVGDDATVQGVVNGMFRDGRTILEEPVLGVIPGGNGSDLARSFGLPNDAGTAAVHMAGEHTYPMDLMKVTASLPDGGHATRYAHNLAQVGMGAEQAARAATAPTWLGGARRFAGFWRGYLATKATAVTVEHDTRTWEGTAWNVVVANAQFTDGGLRLSPRSFPGDGILDALVFTGPRSGAYTLLPRLFRHGDHIPDPHIKELKARIRFEVRSERPFPVVADGVPFGMTPVTFQVVPRPILFKL